VSCITVCFKKSALLTELILVIITYVASVFTKFQGSSAGGAIGIRVGSLNKLLMTKSNTAKMTLLHYLVDEAQKKNKDSLTFVGDLLEPLQQASRSVHFNV
jgi:hypothetical protein